MKNLFLFIYYLSKSILNFLPDNRFGNRIRGKIIGLFIKQKGSNLEISKNTNIMYPWNLKLGNNVYIGYGCWINAMGHIEICDEVIIGPYVCISSGNHTKINNSYRFGEHEIDSVMIKKGTWLAAQSVILAGSSIPEGACIAAGAVGKIVSTKTGIYGGVPAKLIKEDEVK